MQGYTPMLGMRGPLYLSKQLPGGEESAEMKVLLTTGYEVELHEEEGLQHLYQACFGEVLERSGDTDEFRERTFGLVYDVCLVELHYVAGQLKQAGSSIDIHLLLDEFGVFWNSIAAKLNDSEHAA